MSDIPRCSAVSLKKVSEGTLTQNSVREEGVSYTDARKKVSGTLFRFPSF
jgi:hypothetical protein